MFIESNAKVPVSPDDVILAINDLIGSHPIYSGIFEDQRLQGDFTVKLLKKIFGVNYSTTAMEEREKQVELRGL